MIRIMLLTDHADEFAEFADTLAKTGENHVQWFESRKDLLNAIAESPPNLVVIDETVEGISALKAAKEVVMANAMVHIAVVDRLSPEDFHEASEGLGILAQLTPPLGPQEAESLMALLKGMPM